MRTSFPFLLVAAVSVTCGCGGPPPGLAASSVLAPRMLDGVDAEDVFWWIAAGELTSAGAWIGPSTVDPAGHLVRPWTLTVALPQSDERLSCMQGRVRSDSREPIELKGSSFHVRLVPRAGLVWANAASVADLEEVAVGFDR